MNEVVFLISLEVDLSLMYRNAFDLWVLILYPATLLNSFMSSGSFLVEFFGSSKYRIMSLANSDSLSSFPIRIPLVSFICLTALVRVSRMMFNRSGERGHPCLVSVFRGNTFSVFHLE